MKSSLPICGKLLLYLLVVGFKVIRCEKESRVAAEIRLWEAIERPHSVLGRIMEFIFTERTL